AKLGVDATVSDRSRDVEGLGVPLQVSLASTLAPAGETTSSRCRTEWVLLTSGTTGAPKMLAHTFDSLTAALGSRSFKNAEDADVRWATFYDIRRYGGLQILFRAILGRGSFVLAGAGEPIGEY